MEGTNRAIVLTVGRGPNLGDRLVLDARFRTIGRAEDADLVLTDLSVSRRHLQVAATPRGVRFALCAGAAPIVLDGRPIEQGEASVGDVILVGSTTLFVGELADGTNDGEFGDQSTDVRTLLTGPAADVCGLAALFALSEMLDAATDRALLEEALEAWAHAHVHAQAVRFIGEASHHDADLAAEKPNDVVERAVLGTALIAVTVPAHAGATSWIAFDIPRSRVRDSNRRLVLLAGRLFASTWGRLRAKQVVEEAAEPLRQLAIGSARAFLGTSPAAAPLGKLIPKLAASDVTVILYGETGVGKTFVARLIHEEGPRSVEPLRVLNCASIPETLIESELFGHERGAFTGAVAARVGAFEGAGRGTLFLDEIGELPLGSQAKLLRVLEEKRFERVGSNRPLQLRARVIAATNRDLEAMVAQGKFRSDLFFRLSVVSTRVPSLRERGDDIITLAHEILADFSVSANRRIDGFSDDAIAALREHPWPGNVRELRNVIERAVVLGDGSRIEVFDLPQRPAAPGANDLLLATAVERAERAAIENALQVSAGNRSRAAELLGISRVTLYSKLKLNPD